MDEYTDLEWLAFQYVAGDLSEAEREIFEARLADDQLAREAVASAVQLSAACSGAFAAPNIVHLTARPPVSARKRTVQRLTVLAAGVAACVAIAWLGQFRDGGSGPDGQSLRGWAARDATDRDATDRDASTVGSESLWGDRAKMDRQKMAQQLALVWADFSEQLLPEESTPREATSEASELNSSAANGDVNSVEDAELDAPDWLIAALADEPAIDDSSDEG
jgi:ferric-dicitrate binding protein FerR (iron transport regulator)